MGTASSRFDLWAGCAVIGLSALLASDALGVPAGVAYQGRLSFDSGAPYEGTIHASVALYTLEAGGAPVWGPTSLGAVAVHSGAFTVVLGEAPQPSLGGVLGSAPALWLEWTLAGEVLTPRQRVVSVPYALRAADADQLGGSPATAFATQAALDAHEAKAAVGPSAPDAPVPGALWFDTQSQALRAWDGGAWTLALGGAAGGGTLAEVSDGALTNTFADVIASWGGGPQALAASVGSTTSATLSLSEAPGTRLERVAVELEGALYSAAEIRFELRPPAGLGLGAIPLGSVIGAGAPPPQGEIFSAQYDEDTVPALQALAEQGPSGLWVLDAIVDAVTPSPPNPAGRLDAVRIVYGARRADEVVATGGLHVEGATSVGATLDVSEWLRPGDTEAACEPAIAGAIRYRGSAARLEYCNGSEWRPVYSPGLGQDPADPATTCAAILQANPAAPSGAYWINPAGGSLGNAFQAHCEMALAGGGWTLALNLDTSDGHVMWWGNPRWTDGQTYGSPTPPFDGDHVSPAYVSYTQATELLLVVHEQGSVRGFKRFAKHGGGSLLSYLGGGDNTLLGSSVLEADTGGIWTGERLVRQSTQLYANHCVTTGGGSCTAGAVGSPDGDRIGSHQAAPSDNNGGGLGNWHDMGYCCGAPSYAGRACNGSTLRTVSEAQAGWCPGYGSVNQGMFGSDTFRPASCTLGDTSCANANWAGYSGYDYDYALFLR